MFGRGNKDSYLTYKKVNIGLSNISSLVFRDPEHADIINFSKDGYYYAYLCDDKAVIDKKFELIKSYKLWLRVYDDDELILHCFADEIKVYKNEDFCIIQLIHPGNIFENDNEPIFKRKEIERW
jgi:hypothetical protein